MNVFGGWNWLFAYKYYDKFNEIIKVGRNTNLAIAARCAATTTTY